jgi:hypothetical protein
MENMDLTEKEAQRELKRRLYQAVRFGRLDEIVVVLEEGADINAPNAGGTTPLTTAVKYGQYDAARLVLEQGADVNAKNSYAGGPTPMDFAKTQEIIDLLLSYGGDCRWGTIPEEWLRNRLSQEEINEVFTQPSGDNRWECFKAHTMPGDEVWEFKSPIETWEQFAGRRGYAIVREGAVVRAIVTALS